MTPEQVRLVQESFSKVAPIADQAAVLFYDRLFVIAPEVKPLFHGDMAEQRRMLMTALAMIVNNLRDLPSILPAASALARKHVGYGVEAKHYAQVGAALLWTLEHGLGAAWTKPVADAWIEAYTTLSGYMIGEAYVRAAAE